MLLGLSPNELRSARPGTVEEQVAQFFEQTRGDVYRYLMTLGLDPGRAQEAVQEVFLRLYQALKKKDDIDNRRAWVFRVAHNLGLRTRSRDSLMRPYDAEQALQIADPQSNPEKDAIERQRAIQLRRAVESLSPQQRQCLYLRAEGFRYREIAEILGISDSSVGEFLRRAILKLRKATHE